MSDHLVVLSTVAKAEDAERIGRALVEGGLAACVNVLPAVTSIYRWKGKLEKEEERLLVIKTRAAGSRRYASPCGRPSYEVPRCWPCPWPRATRPTSIGSTPARRKPL